MPSKKKHKEKLICFDEEFFQIIITVYMLGNCCNASYSYHLRVSLIKSELGYPQSEVENTAVTSVS